MYLHTYNIYYEQRLICCVADVEKRELCTTIYGDDAGVSRRCFEGTKKRLNSDAKLAIFSVKH